MSDTKNVKLGVCKVFYDGVDLGYTQGGVDVTVKTETHKVNVDQFGKTTINEVILSRDVTAKTPLAETTLENLVKIMPGAVLTEVGGTAATGTITIASNPSDGDTVTVNGVAVTFKTSGATGNQVNIGASAGATATALAAFLNAASQAALSVATYAANASAVTVTYDVKGVAGNAFTLASGQASVTVSGAKLTGGTASTSKKVEVPTGIGTNLLDQAKELRLHPKSLADTDKSEDFVIPLAATPGALNFSYQLEKERIFEVEFNGYPDPNTEKLFYVGA